MLESAAANWLAAVGARRRRLGDRRGRYFDRPVRAGACGPGEMAAELARLSPAETIANSRSRASDVRRQGRVRQPRRRDARSSALRAGDARRARSPARAELAAAGGLLAYLDATQKGAGILLDAPRRIARASHMAIDAATRDSLELTRSVTRQRRRQPARRDRPLPDRRRPAAACEDIAAPLTDTRRDRGAARARCMAARGCDPPRARARRAQSDARLRARACAAGGGPRQPARPRLLRDGLAAADALKRELEGEPDRPPLLDSSAAAARRP